jgi:tripeptide aminopeptidase
MRTPPEHLAYAFIDGDASWSERLTEVFCMLATIPSPSYAEADCAAAVEAMLASSGLTVTRDQVGVMITGNCDNLYCRIPGSRPGVPIFLCAHLDTVPPTAALEPIIVDGVIRNANRAIIGADNKAAVAVLLEVARRIVEEQRPHAEIELVFTVCEEQGLLGARAFDTSHLHARIGFVLDHPGEIGGYVTSAPSRFVVRATMHGRSSHSGIAPDKGNNAIMALARGLAALPAAMADVSVNVGHICGGTAVNVVPDRAEAAVDVRSVDHERAVETTAAIRAGLRATAAASGCTLEIAFDNPYKSYRVTNDSEAVRLFRSACDRRGLTTTPMQTGGGSDASAFRDLGLDCVNLAHGVVDFHGPDEAVAVSDLVLMTQVVLEMVDLATERTAPAISSTDGD